MLAMTEQYPLCDRAAIVGVGTSAFTRRVAKSNLMLAADAFRSALDDAGLAREDVDGVINLMGQPAGIDLDTLVPGLGIRSCFTTQSWGQAPLIGTAVTHACMAVTAGLAHVVAVFAVAGHLKPHAAEPGAAEARRPHGGPHGQDSLYCLDSSMAVAAMATRRYRELYGLTDAQLGAVSIAMRRHACLNPNATTRDPLTPESYLDSPVLEEPLRRPDVGPSTEGACCILVATRERAAACRKPPICIAGFQGMRMGPDELVLSGPGPGVGRQRADGYGSPNDQLVYRMAGVESGEVDLFYASDPFSPLVLFALERFGFCGTGEAGDFVQGGRIEIGGELPVNTNGGLLSEAHVAGANHIVEMVRQLRGECGERQVAGAEIAQWATCHGDSLILLR